ncbi:Recombination endonuclease VII [Candidatus Nanopelagicaceae bacterium]
MTKKRNSEYQSDGTFKKCTGCKERLLISAFGVQKSYPDGLSYRCKNCIREYSKSRSTDPDVILQRRAAVAKYRAKNPDSDVNKTLLNKYGITLDEYNELFEQQQGLCALCKRPETTRRNKKDEGAERLAVDHCHDTGLVRGLLCFKCNTAIGALGDTQEAALRAMNYLSGWAIHVSELNK